MPIPVDVSGDQGSFTGNHHALPPDDRARRRRLVASHLPARPLQAEGGLDAALLGDLERTLRLCPRPTSGGLPGWRLQRVTLHIEANISGRLCVAELAQVAQMSASQFSRTFKQTVGMSPHGYVTSRRVAAAKRLMASADHALADIALLCGAADQAHLNRLFAKFCGVSPGAWRRRLQWSATEAVASGLPMGL